MHSIDMHHKQPTHIFSILNGGYERSVHIQAEDTDIQRLLHWYGRRHAMKAHIVPPTPPTSNTTKKFQGHEERNRLACTWRATKTRAPLKKSLQARRLMSLWAAGPGRRPPPPRRTRGPARFRKILLGAQSQIRAFP